VRIAAQQREQPGGSRGQDSANRIDEDTTMMKRKAAVRMSYG
jgi:hypothetical protein